MRSIAILLFTFLAACELSERDQQYIDWKIYLRERQVERICRDGTKIFSWRGKFFVSDAKQYPDAAITRTPEETCP